jgi:hypothetical protein
MRFRDVGQIVRPEPVFDELPVTLCIPDDNRACVGFDDFTFDVARIDSHAIAISQFRHFKSIRAATMVC